MKILIILLLSVSAYAQNNKVIYGDDNRVDVPVYHDGEIRELAKSTVALIKNDNLVNANGIFNLGSETFGEEWNLCVEERFRDQPEAAFCSGFLVASNKIVTAGHCIKDNHDCSNVKFVFDYVMTEKGSINESFSENQVFSCKKILGRKLESSGIDYAIIELDREVSDRKPLILSNNVNLGEGDELFVIGHPSGLPSKIADGALVKSIHTSSGFFKASLDTYGGNSGSAVFNKRTLEVEGILVRGAKDFVQNGQCFRSNYLGQEEGGGESCSLISLIEENGHSDSTPSGELRYIWLDSDMTCNLFRGDDYITEVDDSLCGRTSTANVRYVYLDSDGTCNEFQGNDYIQEVSISLCSDAPAVRYVWLDSDMTCNEFRGSNYIREVSNSYCL